MKPFLILLISFLIPLLAVADKECDIAKEAIKKASEIRGLAIKKPVPCEVHTKEEVTSFIQDTIKTKIPPEKLHFEEILFKSLGLIPDSFSYAKGMVDLYVSQIGGYYDPEKHYFVMAGWLPEFMQPTIAAHELTHALQDQYYNLSTFVSPKLDNSDMQVAHSSLVEGDATAVMLDYMRGLAGQPGISTESSVDSIILQNSLGAALTIGGSGVPESLQLLLIFPYTSGLRFAHTLLQKGGYVQVDKAFTRPPDSTEEILHPEIYLKGEKSYKVFEEKEASSYLENGKIVYHDTIGEFGVSTLIGTLLGDKVRGARVGEGWGGDKVFVVESSDHAHRIVWLTAWDSEKDRDEFLSAYTEALLKKYKKEEFSLKSSGKEVVAVIKTTQKH